MLELRKGAPGAIAEVRGMSHVPESFRTRLGQTTPEAIEAAKQQSQQAEADSEWADTTYAKREAARKENEAIQDEFDKARKDKTKKQEAMDKWDRHFVDSEADRVARENTKSEHDATAARTKKEHADKSAADKAERDREKWDREHTPEHLTQQEAKAESAAIMDAEREQNQYRADMGALPFDASELEQIKHKVMQGMPEARARGMNLGQLVGWAMAMQANEIEQGMYQGMDRHVRSAQLINPRGGH